MADMRNYLEHPKNDERRTVINNFQLLPDGRLSPPTWHLSGDAPVQIADDMSNIIGFLVRVSEELLVHLVIYCGRERFSFRVRQIADDKMDRDFPVKYCLEAYLKPFQQPGRPTL